MSAGGNLPRVPAADRAARERLAASEAALDRVMAALRAVDDEEEEQALLAQRRALRGRLEALRADAEAAAPELRPTGRTFAEEWALTEAVAARRALLVLAGLDSVTVWPAASHRAEDREARRVVVSWRPDV